jgi:hypothetical protein
VPCSAQAMCYARSITVNHHVVGIKPPKELVPSMLCLVTGEKYQQRKN